MHHSLLACCPVVLIGCAVLQFILGVPWAAQAQQAGEPFVWTRLPDLPFHSEAAGICTGSAGEGLLAAPRTEAARGDSVWTLGRSGAWRRLRVVDVDPRGTTKSGAMHCAWGGAIVALNLQNDVVERRRLPGLPRELEATSVAVVGGTLYAMAGSDIFAWEAASGWTPLEHGPQGVLVPLEGTLYVLGTRAAWALGPARQWRRLPDPPTALEPVTAAALGPSHIVAIGAAIRSQHRPIMAYHTITGTWTPMSALPTEVGVPVAARGRGGLLVLGPVSQAAYRGVVGPSTSRLRDIDFLVLGAYFLALIGMGLAFFRRSESDADFFLARRKIPWWVAGVSIFGTQLSAITFMAIPATAYQADWVYILGQATIVLLAPVIIYAYLPFFRRLQVTTAYEYLEQRFNVAVRLVGSASFVLLQLGRMGIVIFLPAIALTAVTGMNIYMAILLMGLLSTLYTALGGIEAVIWSDVLQVVVLLGGALLSLVLIAISVDGGLSGIISTASGHGKLRIANLTWSHTEAALWVVVIGWTFSNLIPYTADQTVVQRYLTTRDERAAARSIWTNALLTIPASLLFFGLGTALFVFYRENAENLNPMLPTDAIFPLYIVQELPPGIAGLLIAGIFAASMSSLDSSLNSVAAAIVTDFYRRFKRGTTAARRLRLARMLTLMLGAVATAVGLLMAAYEFDSLWNAFLEIMGLLGGALAGLFALGIFTRRANAVGTLMGAGVSGIVVWFVKSQTSVHFLLYAAVGALTCIIVGYLASVAWPRGAPPRPGLTLHYAGHCRRSSSVARS